MEEYENNIANIKVYFCFKICRYINKKNEFYVN